MQHRGGIPVQRPVNALPAEAVAVVSRIEAMLVQAGTLLGRGGSDEAAYALRETERRYLPDTIKAYEDVPLALRDATTRAMFVDQLRLLERATAQRLTVLAESTGTALAANGAFLTERFGHVDTLPEPPANLLAADLPSTMLVRRVFDRLEGEAGANAIAVLERAAVRLGAAFPEIATVSRGGLFGKGPVDAIALDVPRRDDLLRYALERTAHGGIEASVTRFLRGIKGKTLVVELGGWMQSAIEDVGAYVERVHGARENLIRFFKETP